MKKFFLMMSAALLAVSASADVIYSWESPAGEAVEVGGTIAFVNGKDGDARVNYPNDKYYTVCLNGKKGNINDAAASAEAGHMELTLDTELKADDKITFTGFRNKDAEGKKSSVYMLFENGSSFAGVEGGLYWTNIATDETKTIDFDNDGNTPNSYTWTVPAAEAGTKVIKLSRNDAGTNLFFTKLEITREGGEAEVETFDLTVVNGLNENAIAAGETAEKLNWYFYATVPEGAQANHDVEATLTKDGESFSVARAGMMDETTAYWSFRNAAPDYIQEAGVYTLTIPAGAIYTGTAEAHATESAAVELTWTVTGVAEAHSIAILSVKNAGNEAGVVDYVAGTFEVVLAEPVSTIGENQAGAMLINNTTHDVYAISSIIANNDTIAYIRFNIGETSALTAAGEYELQLPEKVLVDEAGNYNEACMGLKWTVEAKEVGTFAVEAAYNGADIVPGTVEALSYQFLLTTANIVTNLGEGYISLTDAEGNEVGGHGTVPFYTESEELYVRFNYGTDDHMLRTPGVYTLNVPAGVLVDAEGNTNEAYTATWTVEAAEYTTINITEVETGVVTDDTFGFNDQHYTVTMHFTAPEGAAFAYCEGLQLSLNGEDSNVPFQCGNWGMATLEGSDVYLVFNDGMLCATDDPDYEGDLRPFGSYVGEAEIYFMDENYLELPYVAKFVGSLVFENVNKVDLMAPSGDPSEAFTFNVDDDPFYGVISMGDLEANGLLVNFPYAKNVTPEMIIKVTASLADYSSLINPFAEDDDIDPGFGVDPQAYTIEFYGDAAFGEPVVNLADFTQAILEVGPGAYVVTLDKVEVIDVTGVAYSWDSSECDYPVGTVFEVTENEDPEPVALSSILAGQKGAIVYNLQGQRVNAAKGLVIINSKKALVK